MKTQTLPKIATGASGNFSLCQSIKSRLSLRDAARLANIELREPDGKKFCSPLRPDRKPSCTIRDNLLSDWSRGEHFDCIKFYAAAKSISNAEAIRELAKHLGLADGQRAGKVKVAGGVSAPEPRPLPAPPSGSVMFEVGEPDDNDFEAIIKSRELPTDAEAGLRLAHDVGVLQFSKVCGFFSWIVTDKSRRIAEARRLDGWDYLDTSDGRLPERKAHTLRGSSKSWPCGLLPAFSDTRLEHLQKFHFVLVEGSPDLLSAYALLAVMPMNELEFHPLAMLGAGAEIHDDALKLLAGRHGIILAHGDPAGAKAGKAWAEQLTGGGCRVTVRELPDGCDLNDTVTRYGLAALERLVRP